MPLMPETLIIGLKEGIKLVIVTLVFYAMILRSGGTRMLVPYAVGVAFSSVLLVLSFFITPDLVFKEALGSLVGYVLFVLLLLSMIALLVENGVDVIGQQARRADSVGLRYLAVFSMAAVYFAPDVIGSSMFLRDIYVMKDYQSGVYVSAALGFFAPVLLSILLKRLDLKRLGAYFGVPQFLLFLAVVKLLGGGIKGFAELSLIPSVQAGIVKFIHDLVHQTFVFLMVPDHQILSTTAWKFIGIFFNARLAEIAALVLLLLPTAVFIYFSRKRPFRIPGPEATDAQRRLSMASDRSERRRRSVPAVFFTIVIIAAWFTSSEGQLSKLYNPVPRPLAHERGLLIIPLNDPSLDIRDGKIHKFTTEARGVSHTIMVVTRPDGKIVASMDACEICPPEGYGQMQDDVVCIYCRTPIPIETLGEPGGCNPIPLKAIVTDKDVRIRVGEIMDKWNLVISGETRKGIR